MFNNILHEKKFENMAMLWVCVIMFLRPFNLINKLNKMLLIGEIYLKKDVTKCSNFSKWAFDFKRYFILVFNIKLNWNDVKI